MKLLSPAISRLARLRQERIEHWMYNPVAVQREVLQHLVTSAQYTEFGRKYNFSKIFSIREFKNAVPIHEYDDLKPYIQRIMNGEQNILWNTPVSWFAKSSGTTSDKSKFIPVSEESLQDCHYKGAKDVLTMYYHFNPDSDLLTGKGLVIGGSHTINQVNEDVHYGDLSAVLLQNSPFWGHWIRTPELSIACWMSGRTRSNGLPGIPSRRMSRPSRVCRPGPWCLSGVSSISPAKAVSRKYGPSLELYIHGGVSFTPYQEQFRKLIGKDINYLDMYNASEGFFAAQGNPHDDGMLLFLDHGIFMEFMPVEEYGKAHPETIGLSDVELGKNYALVINTNGGLWRYLLGDTVQFTSREPFRIKVSGRLNTSSTPLAKRSS